MTRKMAYVGFSYLLGLFLASFFISFATVIGVAATIASLFIVKLRGKKYLVCLICSLFFLVGAVYYMSYDKLCYQKIAAYNGSEVEITGVLTDFSEYNGDKTSYYIDGKINGDIRAKIYCYGDSKMCEIGDVIKVKGTVVVPESSFMYDSFNYFKSKGYFLTMNSPEIEMFHANKRPLLRYIGRYREYIEEKMYSVAGKECMSVISALFLGDKSRLPDNTQKIMYRSGIGHIMAVSGLHLSIVCSLFWFFLQYVDLHKITRIIIILFPMIAFTVLSGASNSIIRADVMLLLVYGSSIFDRRADVMNSLGIAVIFLTIGCPFAVRDASLLLSIAGVIGIAAMSPVVIEYIEKRHRLGVMIKSLIVSAVVSVSVFPVCFLYFNEVSLVSPISNLVLIPFCTVILVCSVIVAMTGGVGFILYPLMKICGICSGFVVWFCEFIGCSRFSYITISNKFTAVTLLTVLAITVSAAVFYRKIKPTVLIYTAACFVSIFSIFIYDLCPTGRIGIAVIQNGSASSLVITYNRQADIFDLYYGGRCASNVAEYLDRKGINRINNLWLTSEQSTYFAYSSELKYCEINTIHYYDDFDFSKLPESENVKIYKREEKIEDSTPYYRFFIQESNTIFFEIKENKILAYDGRKSKKIPVNGEFDALIQYAGQGFPDVLKSGVIIFSDKKAQKEFDNDISAYYGKNILIKFDNYCIETEELSCGNYY